MSEKKSSIAERAESLKAHVYIKKNNNKGILNEIKQKIEQPPQEKVERYSAGILPFYVKGNTVYFLLGQDLAKEYTEEPYYWSDFGGRSELSDNGRWEVTASREFFEETIGSVIDINSMITKLNSKKNYILIKDTTLNGYPYYMYVVRIPYKDNYRTIFKSTLSFLKHIKNNSTNFSTFLEKIDIQWISFETIKDALTNQDTNYPLRSIFKKTLMNNLDTISIFCEKFKETNAYIESIN